MTLPPAYFDSLYDQAVDPWGFETRWYEERKRGLSLAMLDRRAYSTAYEPGCSIGTLTEKLASRCGSLLATDSAVEAVRRARESCRAYPHVRIERATVPRDWPRSTFDLVVLSELSYYFVESDLVDLATRAFRGSRTLLAVHWRHPVADYPLIGDRAHDLLAGVANEQGHTSIARYVDDDFRAELWTADPRSVAAREGLS